MKNEVLLLLSNNNSIFLIEEISNRTDYKLIGMKFSFFVI